MSSRTTQLIRNLLFSWMNKDFLIFLFFLLLSGIFWLMMALNDTYEREVKIPLYLDKIPKKVVVTSSTDDTLRVTLRDRGFYLVPYVYGNMMPLPVNFNSFTKGDGKGTVASSDLQKLINQTIFKSTKITSLKPDRFDYTYNYGESKKVGLRLRSTIVPSQSYYIARVKFRPDQVTAYSDKYKLDSIKYISTEKLDLRNLSDTIVKTVRLATIKGVKCVPSEVEVSVYPDILTEASIEVPITAINTPPGKVLRTFPSRIKVIFVAGASTFRSIHPEQFTVIADYNDIVANPSEKCKLYVKTAPHGVRNPRPEINMVDYLIEGD